MGLGASKGSGLRMITACEDCDHVAPDTRRQSPTRWVCLKFPRIEGFSPVAPKAWVDAEPYMRCVGINGGLCPVFAPRKQPKEQSDD